jgi:hypothetical protein
VRESTLRKNQFIVNLTSEKKAIFKTGGKNGAHAAEENRSMHTNTALHTPFEQQKDFLENHFS